LVIVVPRASTRRGIEFPFDRANPGFEDLETERGKVHAVAGGSVRQHYLKAMGEFHRGV